MEFKLVFRLYRFITSLKTAIKMMNYSISHNNSANTILIIWEESPEGNAVSFYKKKMIINNLSFSEVIFHHRLSFFRILCNFLLRANKSIRSCHFEFAVFGENKGVNSRMVKKWLEFEKLIEVQHGALDSSYFPIESDVFVCRSTDAYNLVKGSPFLGELVAGELDFDVELTRSQQCLGGYDQYILFSKNPGGGVSWRGLANAESKIFRTLSIKNIQFVKHPRDNIFKFGVRHFFYAQNCTYFCHMIIRKLFPHAERHSGRTLSIGLDTTAIIDCCSHGDHVLDVTPLDGGSVRESRIDKRLLAYDLDIFDTKDSSLIEVGVIH
jgi:hypothetical protein